MRRMMYFIFFSVILSMGFMACSEDDDDYSNGDNDRDVPPGQVWMEDNAFMPEERTVTVGSKVTWVNNDDYDHTVISEDNIFNSGSIKADSTFEYTFDSVGTFPYVCNIHPEMTGTIIVEPEE